MADSGSNKDTQEEKPQRDSVEDRAQSTEDPENIDVRHPPEVLEDEDPRESDEELLAAKKQQLITVDHQEANLDHQTLKTPRHHRTSRRISRRSGEWRNLNYPIAMFNHPTPTHTPFFPGTSLDHQPPRLGQVSSQGWVTATEAVGAVVVLGILGTLGFLVILGVLGMRWWRGRRKERCSRKKALRVEEGLGKRQEEDEDTPGM